MFHDSGDKAGLRVANDTPVPGRVVEHASDQRDKRAGFMMCTKQALDG